MRNDIRYIIKKGKKYLKTACINPEIDDYSSCIYDAFWFSSTGEAASYIRDSIFNDQNLVHIAEINVSIREVVQD